ncbi:MAG: hypothetical protein A3E84_00040 [Gammaproteobacteria bacterium RIFCSPHIGHO2_12_FULL_42_13]|nr:MAG: hypothetical protein A3E84_00040 [Gammaproteobacteria bacterium RIFCSPHIGHO2_12_FULL_42_13]
MLKRLSTITMATLLSTTAAIAGSINSDSNVISITNNGLLGYFKPINNEVPLPPNNGSFYIKVFNPPRINPNFKPPTVICEPIACKDVTQPGGGHAYETVAEVPYGTKEIMTFSGATFLPAITNITVFAKPTAWTYAAYFRVPYSSGTPTLDITSADSSYYYGQCQSKTNGCIPN